MATVLEAPSPEMQHFPAEEMPPFAAGSNSQTQVVEINPGGGQEKTQLTPKNIIQKITQFARHRLGPDHLFGSGMTALYLNRWATNVLSTFPQDVQPEGKSKGINALEKVRFILTPQNIMKAVQQTDGEKANNESNKPRVAMMAGSYLAFFTNVLMFGLQRGGTPPQGKNLGQKTFAAFQHPNLSSMFLNCVMMGAALLAISGGKVMGGFSQLRKINDGTMLDAMKNQVGGNDELAKEMLGLNKRAETMRVASGLFYLVAAPITYISMFKMGDKKDKEQPSGQPPLTVEQEIDKMKTMAAFKASQTRVFSFANLKKALEPYNPKNIKGALGYAYSNDKLGSIARSCMVAAEALQAGEGWMRGLKKADVLKRSGADDDTIKTAAAGARNTMVSGIWGVVLTIGHAIYSYGRVLAESRQKATNGQEMVR